MSQTTEVGHALQQIMPASDVGLRQGYREAWGIGAQLLQSYWVYILVVIVILYFIAWRELTQGNWGMMGRVLYQTVYIAAIVLFGLIAGPERFGSEYIHLAGVVILYPACYWLVGLVLRKLGVNISPAKKIAVMSRVKGVF
ncbi:MAG: hypothetical protein KBD66_03625 [Candidatus Doudnabacteria bacterium]|nr:hypothetical protein [Candidatus Doudnabacteria bacterium]